MANLFFTVKTGLKDIIGKDLITDDNIAVFELVKNSYDAHATKVIITFDDNKIIIADNGKGMSLSDLKNKWLAVAYSAKKDGTEDEEESLEKRESYRDKIKSRRYYAGAKGIGRFSCDRLGEKLTLTTQKEKNPTHQLDIEWKDFEKDQKEDFEKVHVQYKDVSNNQIIFPDNSNSGTILEIHNCVFWDRPKIKSLKHSLEKLINPFSETTDFNIEIICKRELQEDNAIKDGSSKYIDRDKINGSIRNSITDILKLKTTEINVKLTHEIIETKVFDRGTLIYHIEEKNIFNKYIDDLRINLYYLNRSAKFNFTKRMGVEPVNYGSVFLFKNGFRVQPYGNTGDDSWQLDYKAQQGYNRHLGTRDLFGRVDIVTDNTEQFREVSSRDGGMVKTPGYEQMVKVFEQKAHKRLERYVTGVLWGEAFKKNKYFKSDDEAQKFRDALLEKDKDSEDISIPKSNVGSKIDFIRLIKSLSDEKDVKIIEYNKDLVDLINDNLEDVQPKFIKDLEKIAEATCDNNLINTISLTEEAFRHLTQEREDAIRKAEEEEKKRREAEERARVAEENRLLAERKAKEAEELKIKAELEKEKKEKERALAELSKIKAEQKAKDEEEKRKQAEIDKRQAETKLEKKTEQLKIVTSLSSQDLEAVTNLHHQTNVVADNINAMITRFSRKLEKGKPVNYAEIIDFLNDISLENSKIVSFSRFGIKNIFDDFTTKKQYDIIDFLKNYIDKVATQFAGSRLKITFNNNTKSLFNSIFAPIDISVIVDNMISNAKKAGANILNVQTSLIENSLIIEFISNKPFDNKITDVDDIFERGFSTTKSTGVGLFHIKNIVEDNGWKIRAIKFDDKVNFLITINHENKLQNSLV